MVIRRGDRLGGYEVLEELKTGGMATLFLGRPLASADADARVAIKVIHPYLAEDARFREMFVDEARISARIRHPNVVRVEELGEDVGVHFLAMELVHGVSLSRVLRSLALAKRRMAPEVGVAIAAAVAEGLHAAHETRGDDGAPLGIVHRDVTPENVLLSFDGRVKVVDFGVAKARDRVRETTAGILKGKFGYMSPEHARAEPVDRRSDVYALGIVTWELLTMRRYLRGANELALLEAAKHPTPRSPREVASHLAPALAEVVMTALAPRPEDRYPTAEAFARALREACPEARSVDAAQLAALLAAIGDEEIERERASLPSPVTPRPADPTPVGPATVRPRAPRTVSPTALVVAAVLAALLGAGVGLLVRASRAHPAAAPTSAPAARDLD